MARADINARLNLESNGFERGLQRSKKGISTFIKTAIGPLTAAMGAAGLAGAFIRGATGAIDIAKNLKELAQVAGAGVEEFQRYSQAARTVNIEQDKLADIFKDTNDKIGDFIQTGAGPMADFFEKIAPKVGATKQEFIGLSGPEALQRYFNYLQKSNLSQQEMTFYMEAIASDATMLIPLLKDGGAAFKALGDEAEENGRIMKESTIEALDKAQERIDRFKQGATIAIGKVLGVILGAKEEIEELAETQLEDEGKFVGKSKRGSVRSVLIENRIALLQKEKAEAEELARKEREAAIEAEKAENERIKLLKERLETSKNITKELKSQIEKETDPKRKEDLEKRLNKEVKSIELSEVKKKNLEEQIDRERAITEEKRSQNVEDAKSLAFTEKKFQVGSDGLNEQALSTEKLKYVLQQTKDEIKSINKQVGMRSPDAADFLTFGLKKDVSDIENELKLRERFQRFEGSRAQSLVFQNPFERERLSNVANPPANKETLDLLKDIRGGITSITKTTTKLDRGLS